VSLLIPNQEILTLKSGVLTTSVSVEARTEVVVKEVNDVVVRSVSVEASSKVVVKEVKDVV
jgi:hypothetical protein